MRSSFCRREWTVKIARLVALTTVLVTIVPALILLFTFKPGVIEPQFAYGPPAAPTG